MTLRSLPSRFARPARRAGFAVAGLLAVSVGLAAWAATEPSGPPGPPPGMPIGGPFLPHGPMLDHLLDEAQVSATQRAQVHQILSAAESELAAGHDAARADHDAMKALFLQPVVDGAAVEALREREEARHDAATRRMTQAMVDIAQVLTVDQRRAISTRLAAGPHPGDGHRPPMPSSPQ